MENIEIGCGLGRVHGFQIKYQKIIK